MKSTPRRLAVAAFSLLPLIAFAHPGHEESTLPWGVRHPFTGVDHMLALLAVGLWAAQLGGRSRVTLPAAFLAALLGGLAFGAAGFGSPAIDGMILASLLALGALLATAWKTPATVSATVVALAGLAHGAAHGAELPANGSSVAWVAGVAIASAALLGLGIFLGTSAQRFSRSSWIRIAGGLIAGAGLVLAAG